ncbi:MAG: chromate transporter [Nitrospiraceae bacterium]|nr:chromate transporter [Nitrospiraceae bacterium]
MDRDRTDLGKIFLVFLRIGAFAYGGVYSMLGFFERELVGKRGWISGEDFTEGVAIGQLTPGAPIVNTALFIGYRLRRLKGALASFLGLVLPSFVMVLFISFLYVRYRDAAPVRGALKGVSAAVAGMIASVVLNMGRRVVKGRTDAMFAVAGFLGLLLLRVNPVVLILAAGTGGLLVYGRIKNVRPGRS